MPLKIGGSKKTLVENFKTEKAHGKPEDQAWAIAFETRRRAGKKKGKKRKGVRFPGTSSDDHDYR